MAGKDIFIMQRNADDTGWETKTIPASNDGVLATNISGSLEAVTKASLALGSETGSLVRNDQTSSMSVASASIATTAQSVHYDNVTNKPTLISGSAQIADEISGSFNEFSASAAIVASTVIKHSTQLVSLQSATSSYALSANISGAFAADSSSLASRLDIVEGGANVYISASNQNADLGNVTATKLTVAGDIRAYAIYASIQSSSINYSSGSTKFGDSIDDTHETTGSAKITGSLNVVGHVTASGVVSASAFIGDGSQLTGISSGGSGGTLQSGSAVALILVDSGSGGGGGNPRGGSAVDLQRQRNRATQVAGGFFSFVVGRGNSATSTSAGAVGGEYNLVNGAHSVVAGGTYNTGSSVDVFVGGGCRNAAIANSSAIIGGKLNFTCNNTATVVGGCLNAVSGLRSSVIGGQNNCITNTGNDSMIIGGQGNCLIHCNSVILAGTNITSSAINTTYVNNLSITGNLTGNLNVVGHVTASGTVSASAFIGDGSQLTGILAGGLSGSTLQGAPNASVLGGCAIDGGDVFITAGETTCPALSGGCVIVRGGVNTINRGGDVRIYGGCSTNTFSGGAIVVQGGNNSSTGTSGLAVLRGGLGAKGGMGAVDGGPGTTQAGCARLSGGYSLSGTAGNVNVYGGGSTTSPGCVTISGGSGVYFGGSGADVIIRGGLPGGVTCNLGNSGNVTICTPDALGTSKNSGDITIEVGSATGTKGNLKLMSLPTSPAGLPSGSVWRDNAASNTLKIV